MSPLEPVPVVELEPGDLVKVILPEQDGVRKLEHVIVVKRRPMPSPTLRKYDVIADPSD